LWQYPKINIDALKHVEKNVLIACQCKWVMQTFCAATKFTRYFSANSKVFSGMTWIAPDWAPFTIKTMKLPANYANSWSTTLANWFSNC
jgi:hypothetical protein